MNKTIATMAAIAMVAGQATVASASTKAATRAVKEVAPACAAPLKSQKMARKVVVENRCQAEAAAGSGAGGLAGIGTTGLIFGGAIVAGVVAVAVTTTNNNSATSP